VAEAVIEVAVTVTGLVGGMVAGAMYVAATV
jgi:hypothetical protein